MKLGIRYCGGCNPTIDLRILTKRLRENLKPDTDVFEYFDSHDCEVVVILNGCNVGCVQVQKSQNPIAVYGSDIDGKQYSEESLPSE